RPDGAVLAGAARPFATAALGPPAPHRRHRATRGPALGAGLARLASAGRLAGRRCLRGALMSEPAAVRPVDPRTAFAGEPRVSLADASAAVLGCGSVGGLAAWTLASAGV